MTTIETPAQPLSGDASESSWARTIFKFLFGFVLPLAILGAGVFVLMIAGKLKPEPKKQIKDSSLPRVETATISAYDQGMSIDVDGSVVPYREISLSSEVAGRVKHKAAECEAGIYVKAGTLLFEVDPLDFELEVRRLNKEVHQAEINVHSIDVETENTRSLMVLAKDDIDLQQREVSRLRKLVEDRAASRSELDGALRSAVASSNAMELLKNRARLLVTQRATQQAALDLAITRLEKAQIDLKRTKIVAPIDGVVVRELVEEDSYVQRGAPLVQIEDTSAVEVKCDLRLDQLYLLWSEEHQNGQPESAAAGPSLSYEIPNTPAQVVVNIAGRQFAWQGKLARYDGIGLNTRTRTVPCRVLVADPLGGTPIGDTPVGHAAPPALVRGMYVTVSLQLDPMENYARIPIEALKPGNVIWRIQDGQLQIEKVRVARISDDDVLLELTGGEFQIGDQVVTTPLPSPASGMPVDYGQDAGAPQSTASSGPVERGTESEELGPTARRESNLIEKRLERAR